MWIVHGIKPPQGLTFDPDFYPKTFNDKEEAKQLMKTGELMGAVLKLTPDIMDCPHCLALNTVRLNRQKLFCCNNCFRDPFDNILTDFNEAKFSTLDKVELTDGGTGIIEALIYNGKMFIYKIAVLTGCYDNIRNDLKELWIEENSLKLLEHRVIELGLCEQNHLTLKPNQFYIFHARSNCLDCKKLMKGK